MADATTTKTTRDPPDALSLQAHRRIVGLVGIMLPLLVYLWAGVRPTAGLPRWRLLWSVSSYYYTGAVTVFVGLLFALSFFLFSYRGYKGVAADRIVGWVGGLAALVVALFPTAAPAGAVEPTWWTAKTGLLHYVAAVVLFVSFILFALWLFRKSDTPRRRDRPPDKRRRDDACLACGLVMIACVVWAGVASYVDRPIFVPESIAIVAFAVSWLVKGEAHEPVLRAVRRLMRGRLPSPAGRGSG
jgi:heme/copper-type cytochrome/quinol oxidase subunit 2